MKHAVLTLLMALTAGCASKPSSISLAEVDDVTLTQVRNDYAAYQDSLVRWGGVVTEVENRADETWIFLVSRALKNDEKPIIDGQSEGRFIASFSGFIDPLVYKRGRPLTVIGVVEGNTVLPIGEYEYNFPIVTVRDSHLWADPAKERVYYPPPYWYYDMHYYHRYPYRHRHW